MGEGSKHREGQCKGPVGSQRRSALAEHLRGGGRERGGDSGNRPCGALWAVGGRNFILKEGAPMEGSKCDVVSRAVFMSVISVSFETLMSLSLFLCLSVPLSLGPGFHSVSKRGPGSHPGKQMQQDPE